jgi:DNA replication and repair protein RecF
MYLKKISLFNYKNFSNFEFDGKIICFVGKTVSEKRMYLMLFIIYPTAKLFQSTGSQNIKHGEEFFVIDAEFKKMRETNR